MEKPAYLVIHRGQWRYLPPAQAVKDGVVKSYMLGTDQTAAFAYAAAENLKLDEFRQHLKHIKKISSDSDIELLIQGYLASDAYKALAPLTKQGYALAFKHWLEKGTVGGRRLGRIKISNLDAITCQKIYDIMAKVSVSNANNCLAVFRLLFSYATRNGYCQFNPFKAVKKQTTKPRRVTWERQHVRAFLNVAYSNWKTRSVGLIVHMAYELAQRSTDMRLIKWADYDAAKGVLVVVQSKRCSRVELPVSKGLQQMLEQQAKDFDWQQYIAPSLRRDGKQGLLPYNLHSFNKAATALMEQSNLPEHLTVRDLRRTAITEMVEAASPLPNIMAVTGHASLQSLTPYVKNTLRSASVAQTMRNYPEYLMEEPV